SPRAFVRHSNTPVLHDSIAPDTNNRQLLLIFPQVIREVFYFANKIISMITPRLTPNPWHLRTIPRRPLFFAPFAASASYPPRCSKPVDPLPSTQPFVRNQRNSPQKSQGLQHRQPLHPRVSLSPPTQS